MRGLLRRLAVWILRKTGDVEFTFTIACRCGTFFQVYLPNGCSHLQLALKGRVTGVKPQVERIENVRGLKGNGGNDLRN